MLCVHRRRRLDVRVSDANLLAPQPGMAQSESKSAAREWVSYTVSDGVVVIQFQDPRRKNAWSKPLLDAMVSAATIITARLLSPAAAAPTVHVAAAIPPLSAA